LDIGVFAVKEGSVARPTLPGLGIIVNEEKVREMAKVGHNWKNPVWRNQDGSVTEW
jgi:galactonate dehydratase